MVIVKAGDKVQAQNGKLVTILKIRKQGREIILDVIDQQGHLETKKLSEVKIR